MAQFVKTPPSTRPPSRCKKVRCKKESRMPKHPQVSQLFQSPYFQPAPNKLDNLPKNASFCSIACCGYSDTVVWGDTVTGGGVHPVLVICPPWWLLACAPPILPPPPPPSSAPPHP